MKAWTRWAPALSLLNAVLVVLALLQARFFILLDSRATRRHVEAIPLDYHIPYVPVAVLPYISVYVLLGVTFVIFARGSAWRLSVFLLAFIFLWGVGDFFWSIYPTVNVIRPHQLGHGWLDDLVKLNYGPGRDTLPSGHNMTAWLCAFALVAERVRHASGFVLWAAVISAATLFVRQHYLADVAVSIPLAYGAFHLVDYAVSHELRAITNGERTSPN